ncbi:MAG: UDP-3-O-(3-hydroxymyristoyl)glucosamine N-acyltransferase [Nitrospiraceae bacterium]
MPPQPESQAIRLDEIAKTVAGQVVGSPDVVTTGVSSLEEARPGDLSYIEGDRFIKTALTSNASAFIVGRPIAEITRPQLVVRNPKYAFAEIVQRFFVPSYRARGVAAQVAQGTGVEIGADVSIWPFVTIGDRARIGARVTLYPGVFIGDDCLVGDDSTLYPNVTVLHGCTIGNRVTIHSGTVVGSDGFGYVQQDGRHHKIPQVGTVVIGDDVELGANVTVDRATFGRTVIKRGTKVDNLVQVAHNVSVGEDCILVAQVGIAGSSSLGNHVVVGGQAGISDHVEIGDRVMIGAGSGVHRNLKGDQIVSGMPAMPHAVALKAQALISHLPELRQHLRDLEERVRQMEATSRSPRKKSRTAK